MRNSFTLIFSILIFNSFAQWQVLGARKFSPGSVSSISLEINKGGVPYVAYQDLSNGKKASVMKFDGSNWVYVGAPCFTPNAANDLHFVIDKNDTLYVAYSNGPDSMVYAQKFNGTNWQYIGPPVLKSIYTDIVIDRNNFPNVAVVTGNDSYGTSDTIFVKKLIGNSWFTVGGTYVCAAASIPEIETDTSGFLYLAASSRGLNYGTLFFTFNNTLWQAAGGLAYREYVRLKSDNKNKVLIVNKTVNAPGYTGPPNLVDFKTSGVLYTLTSTFYGSYDVGIDSSANPYYLYANPMGSSCGSGCVNMEYVIVGVSTTSFSTNFGTTGPCKITIDNGNGSMRGTGYIAFMDTSSVGLQQLTVISCRNPMTTGVNEISRLQENISVYPNPANDFLIVTSSKEFGGLTLLNSLGEVIYLEEIPGNKAEINLSGFSPGIYMVKGDNGWCKKIIKR